MTKRHHWNVEFLTRLTTANSYFQARIRQRVPDRLTLRDRANKVQEVGPDDSGYESIHRRFAAEVSDANSLLILKFLYEFHVEFKDNIHLFERRHARYFADQPGRWEEIRDDHPRIYQTTLCYLLTGKNSDTLVSYRLEDLERLGLVARSDARPPKRKHVNITSAGIEVLESAIEEAYASLRPITAPDTAFPPTKSPQPCSSAKAPEPGLPLEAKEPDSSEQPLIDKRK